MDFSLVTGTNAVAQIVVAVLIILVLIIVVSTTETIVNWFTKVGSLALDLIPNTVSATTMRRIPQNPSTSGAITLPRSDNELNGLEFSYATWLYIDPSTFSTDPSTPSNALKHVFHKGTNGMFPLMAPGVFVSATSNKLVIYMNSFDKWNNIITVNNMPVQKWIHLVIVAKGKSVDVYVNGNIIAHKILQTYPKQNYGDVYFFNTQSKRLGPNTNVPQTDPMYPTINESHPLVLGTFTGNLSRARYYSYAMTFAEIRTLLSEGPSTKVDSASQDVPPYMANSWWVNTYTS